MKSSKVPLRTLSLEKGGEVTAGAHFVYAKALGTLELRFPELLSRITRAVIDKKPVNARGYLGNPEIRNLSIFGHEVSGQPGFVMLLKDALPFFEQALSFKTNGTVKIENPMCPNTHEWEEVEIGISAGDFLRVVK